MKKIYFEHDENGKPIAYHEIKETDDVNTIKDFKTICAENKKEDEAKKKITKEQEEKRLSKIEDYIRFLVKDVLSLKRNCLELAGVDTTDLTGADIIKEYSKTFGGKEDEEE